MLKLSYVRYIIHVIFIFPIYLKCRSPEKSNKCVCSNILEPVYHMYLLLQFSGTFSALLCRVKARIGTERDQRIRNLQEIVVGINEVRMNTWEYPLARIIEFTRK